MTLIAQVTKEKTDKLDFIKIKNVRASKNIIKKAKGQPEEWKKMFTNYTHDKELISRIYKELPNSITEK